METARLAIKNGTLFVARTPGCFWGEGNEAFWGWLQERGYGLADFWIRWTPGQRDHRFRDSGLINQPGMKGQGDPCKRVLGLYLDQADGDEIKLNTTRRRVWMGRANPSTRPPQAPPGHPALVFKPGGQKLV